MPLFLKSQECARLLDNIAWGGGSTTQDRNGLPSRARAAPWVLPPRQACTAQEFCALVNDEARDSDRHASVCGACGDGGDLLCCDGCPAAVHPLCVGLEQIPEVGGGFVIYSCIKRCYHIRLLRWHFAGQ